jgi:hypothetical protein
MLVIARLFQLIAATGIAAILAGVIVYVDLSWLASGLVTQLGAILVGLFALAFAGAALGGLAGILRLLFGR